MKRTLKIATATLVALILSACQPKERVSLPIDVESCGLALMDVTVGVDTVSFIIDTGSDMTVVDEGFERFDVMRIHGSETIEMVTVNGIEDKTMWHGFITVNDTIGIRMRVMDINGIVKTASAKSNKDVIGLIGIDFLNDRNSILDFENNTITFDVR